MSGETEVSESHTEGFEHQTFAANSMDEDPALRGGGDGDFVHHDVENWWSGRGSGEDRADLAAHL